MMITMRTARVYQWGGPDVLQIEEVPVPEPGEGEILVRVRAAGVNPVDSGTRDGYFRNVLSLPYTLGWDVAGEVAALGSGVQGFEIGDAVYAMIMMRGGAFAEYAIVRAEEAAPKPASLDFIEAAAVPAVALTSWQGLIEQGQLKAGQKVLIHAAAGGTGSAAVQLARWKGAYIIGTGSESNREFVLGLGADEFIDYNTTRFEEVVQDADVVYVAHRGDILGRSYATVKPGGIIVSITDKPTPEQAAHPTIRALWVQVVPNRSQLEQITQLIDSGSFKVTVSAVYPLEDAKAALHQNSLGHTRGKIVLEVA
jgi:NADPH:quinone reductase-like Zn-dependent oxidoreductase